VKDGETMVIIGYSGTGKSVALKHIVGLLEPDAGEVTVDGQVVSSLDDVGLGALRATIGYVFQFAALFDSMNVYDNIALGLRRQRIDPHDIGERVRNRWPWSVWRGVRRVCRSNFLAACASAWGLPGPSRCGRAMCCMMNPPPDSIR